jgi:hypothetical protein
MIQIFTQTKAKKIANKMVDYTLDKKKLRKKKLIVRKSHIRHRVTMPGNSKRNRENLVKTELEYSDISSEEKDENKSLVKRRDKRDDDNDDPKEISSNNNIKIIKNALKLDNSSSSKSK